MVGANDSARTQSRRFVVLVAAGSGSRLGGTIPKAFRKIGANSLLFHSAKTAITTEKLCGCVCVVPLDWEQAARQELAGLPPDYLNTVRISFTVGGATRNASVANGIAQLEREHSLAEGDIIGVHDAARCLATKDLFDRCFSSAITYGAAVVALPVRDTLKRGAQGVVDPQFTVEREGLYGMQTPQVFTYKLLKDGLASPDATVATDEVSLVQNLTSVHLVEGAYANLKVTYPEDLILAQKLMAS